VIYVEAGDENVVLACFEEGLRYRKLGAVVAEVGHLSVTASRPLQLAADGFGVASTLAAAVPFLAKGRPWWGKCDSQELGAVRSSRAGWRAQGEAICDILLSVTFY
jgi:protein ImuA